MRVVRGLEHPMQEHRLLSLKKAEGDLTCVNKCLDGRSKGDPDFA